MVSQLPIPSAKDSHPIQATCRVYPQGGGDMKNKITMLNDTCTAIITELPSPSPSQSPAVTERAHMTWQRTLGSPGWRCRRNASWDKSRETHRPGESATLPLRAVAEWIFNLCSRIIVTSSALPPILPKWILELFIFPWIEYTVLKIIKK